MRSDDQRVIWRAICEHCTVQQVNLITAMVLAERNERERALGADDGKHDEAMDMQTVKERDDFEERLTILAEAVGRYFDVPVGEWSSANSPDREALKILNGEYKTKFDRQRTPSPTEAPPEDFPVPAHGRLESATIVSPKPQAGDVIAQVRSIIREGISRFRSNQEMAGEVSRVIVRALHNEEYTNFDQ